MRRSVALLTLSLLGPRLLWGQHVSPERLPLIEQFRMGFFVHDRIVAALPGYVGFANGTYQLSVSWQAYVYAYDVRCDAETCHIESVGQIDGDYVVTGCATATFGGASGVAPPPEARGLLTPAPRAVHH